MPNSANELSRHDVATDVAVGGGKAFGLQPHLGTL